MKRVLIVLGILIFTIVMYLLILFTFVKSGTNIDSIYYFESIDTYLQIKRPYGKYGYVLINNSNPVDNIEGHYLKVYKSDVSTILLKIDTLNRNRIYILDRFNNIDAYLPGYDIVQVNGNDSEIIQNEYESVHDCLEILIDGNLLYVYVNKDDDSFVKLQPVTVRHTKKTQRQR